MELNLDFFGGWGAWLIVRLKNPYSPPNNHSGCSVWANFFAPQGGLRYLVNSFFVSMAKHDLFDKEKWRAQFLGSSFAPAR